MFEKFGLKNYRFPAGQQCSHLIGLFPHVYNFACIESPQNSGELSVGCKFLFCSRGKQYLCDRVKRTMASGKECRMIIGCSLFLFS